MNLLVKATPFVAFLLLGFLFAIHPSDLVMAGSLISGGVVLVQMFMKLLNVRRLSDVGTLALIGLCALGLGFLSLRSGFAVRDALFRSKITDYRAAARLMINQSGVQPSGAASLPSHYSHLAKGAIVQKTEDGTATVVFILGGTFPVRHFGYVYRSSDEIDNWSDQRVFAARFHKVAPYWFGF